MPKENYLKKEKTIVTPDKHPTVDLRSPVVRAYLDAKSLDIKAKLLKKYSLLKLDYQNIKFVWHVEDTNRPFLVTFSLNKDFSDSFSYIVYEEILEAHFAFEAGRKYYWKITNYNASKVFYVSWFKTKDTPGNFLDIQNCNNIRDIGGWPTLDGKRVKRGLIYRGSRLNEWELGENRSQYEREGYLTITQQLKWKSEIDLRYKDCGGQDRCLWDESAPYLKRSIGCYVEMFPDIIWPGPRTHYTHNDMPYMIRDIFNFLADESHLPCYFHCNGGADRTGTIAWILNALLGVNEEHLFEDYELTSFTVWNRRWRANIINNKFVGEEMVNEEIFWVVMGPLPRLMMEKFGTGDGKLSSATENYLISYCGVEKETINKFKKIMLEDYN